MSWLAVFILRLVLPLTILRRPLAGNLLAFFADAFDVVIFDFLGGQDYSRYDFYDKWLDLYWYAVALYAALSWKNKLASKTLVFLFALRALGTLLFTLSGDKTLLFFFPDLFVWFLLFYLLWLKIFRKDPFAKLSALLLLLIILTPLKLFQEYLLHFDVVDFYNWVWTNIYTPLGLDKIM